MALVNKTFSDIITFTRASTGTFFNSAGVLTSAATNAPRFDYNPSTLAAQGLLIEESRTNSIRNNTMVGAAAGTPGTAPTNWAMTAAGGNITSREIVGIGTENGVTYIEVRYVFSGAATANVRHEQAGTVTASVSQVWSATAYVKLVAGSLSNITTNQSITQYDSGFVGLEVSTTAFVPTVSALQTQRYSHIKTLNQATVASVASTVQIVASGAADVTLRIGLPQLENNNISTGVASATVVAGGTGYAIGDVLQIVGGTSSTAARVTVATLSGSAVATVTVSTAGSYSVFPSPQPVSVTAITGAGSSATFNIVPQAQTGFATSVIPTDNTAPLGKTRAADVASVNTLSPWYNASEGTLFAEIMLYALPPTGAFPAYADINNGTTNERIALSSNQFANHRVTVRNTAGVIFDANAGGSIVANVTSKWAVAAKSGDFSSAYNGIAGAVSSATGMPAGLTTLRIGSAAGANQASGWIRRITYYPRRLSNAELQAITV
jgi:hypothetical protein